MQDLIIWGSESEQIEQSQFDSPGNYASRSTGLKPNPKPTPSFHRQNLSGTCEKAAVYLALGHRRCLEFGFDYIHWVANKPRNEASESTRDQSVMQLELMM
jgi:hypothetical protein